MAIRLFLWVFGLLIVSPVKELDAGSPQQPTEASEAANSGTSIRSGIRADRLSERQLKTWRSIQDIVFARDASGRFRHPTLEALWRQAKDSGYVIYIEFCKQPFRWAAAGGDFHVEEPCPGRQTRTAVIRLYLSVIDRVQVDSQDGGTLGFVPLLGLSKTERYAEVLGHELSHAVWVLANPDLTKLCERRPHPGGKVPEGIDERLFRLESLMGPLEARARATESEIWRELSRGRGRPSSF